MFSLFCLSYILSHPCRNWLRTVQYSTAPSRLTALRNPVLYTIAAALLVAFSIMYRYAQTTDWLPPDTFAIRQPLL